jgi:hypothetical protein
MFSGNQLMDSSSQNQTDKIILGNCLSCQGLVRVPQKAPSNARVRCPHCAEAYALWQILDQSVPELELVDDSEDIEIIPRVDQVLNASVDADAGREVFVVPPQLSKGAKRSRRQRSGKSDSGSDSSSSGERSSRRKKHKHKPTTWESSASLKRRRAGNPTFEVIKIVVGGLLALPIAYLLVFWVFKLDPLNIGPSISKIAPFVVPNELRGEDKKAEAESKDESSSAATDSTDSSLINDTDLLAIPEIDPDDIKIGTDQ